MILFFGNNIQAGVWLGSEPGQNLTFELGGLAKNGKNIKAYNLNGYGLVRKFAGSLPTYEDYILANSSTFRQILFGIFL